MNFCQRETAISKDSFIDEFRPPTPLEQGSSQIVHGLGGVLHGFALYTASRERIPTVESLYTARQSGVLYRSSLYTASRARFSTGLPIPPSLSSSTPTTNENGGISHPYPCFLLGVRVGAVSLQIHSALQLKIRVLLFHSGLQRSRPFLSGNMMTYSS